MASLQSTAQQTQSAQTKSVSIQDPFPYAERSSRIPYTAEYLTERAAFLDRAGHEFGLSSDSARARMSHWCDQLWQFGTPPSFLNSMKINFCELPTQNQINPGSGNGLLFDFPDRGHKFLSNLQHYRQWQKDSGNLPYQFSPGFEDRWLSATHNSTDRIPHEFISKFEQCGCCQSVARELQLRNGVEHQTEIDERNAASLYLVNAYPWDPGTMLFTSLRDDDLSERTPLCHKSRSATVTAGKTLGASTSAVWLKSFFSLADQNQSVAIINHPLSGMSAPDHFHGQSFPIETPKGHVHREELSDPTLLPSTFSPVVAMRSPHHPFDTLMVKGCSTEDVAQVVSQLRNKLEECGVVHTLSYHQRCCFIGVMTPQENYQFSDLGARMVLKCFRQSELDNWETAVKGILPEFGTFRWKEYTAEIPMLATCLPQVDL